MCRMSDLVERAIDFATKAHRRIDQRRKYTSQPFETHLRHVAGIVAEVADDAEMIAAAWLHDTVEDTPATLDDVEREFGREVRGLVAELTDVSRPSDGNRSQRKAIDRERLSRASARSKTIKLADLIDNCPDICKHDARFGRVFLDEMARLLRVLGDGHPQLLERARGEHAKWSDELGEGSDESAAVAELELSEWDVNLRSSRTVQQFARVFTAIDIAEPLRSFDQTRPASEAAAMMAAESLIVTGSRAKGRVVGYLSADTVRGHRGKCLEASREFAPHQVVEAHTALSVVIRVLTLHDACFVRVLEDVNGVITRADIQKPLVRMWLFGIITFVEMRLDARIRELWSEKEWTAKLSAGRLKKTRELFAERLRRGDTCELIDCLQFADRAQLLARNDEERRALGFPSKAVAERVMKELQSLRNKLAHSQDIVTHDWAQIARLARRIEDLVFAR